ncbi:tetratricopeptide repeat protein [Sporolactobacillus putidus]|uniref:Tetratricopeptide repeat protein n=1 Tax=Sporolactobacillus putidus TaxID=492735 RepID=A0A917RWN4_9BACL|nr:tetratricopeptide repeat protein [Sporolactobacillus putidus]GGL41443.1 hypothetical protein GCM10007968_01630 [Sporolactobacillus putidus]
MKKNGKPVRREGKVVMLPDLESRLLNKAMSLVEEKNYGEARPLFGKLLELDAGDLKGLYGWAICSVELGDYHQAEEAVIQLLEGGAPHYDDVFRLYLTILIEKKDYQGALDKIDQMNSRKDLSADTKEFLRQMKRFCELRINEPGQVAETPGRKRQPHTNGSSRDLRSSEPIDWPALEKADPKTQMLLIRKLAGRLNNEYLPRMKQFLLDEKQNPEVKTMLMCVIKENHLASQIKVSKFGEVYHVTFDSQFLYKEFADQIEKQIESVLSSENPTLADLAKNVGRFFTMNAYPKPLDPPSAKVWAAVFSIRAAMAGDIEWEEDRILDLFDVSRKEFQAAVRTVREIEVRGTW